MKIVIVSDTHNEHERLGILSGDVLVHCGDMFNLFRQSTDDMRSLDDWFGRQDFDVVLCIGGNHDTALEQHVEAGASPFANAVFLKDESYSHSGVNFYGSPWTPDLPGHAFQQRADELGKYWSRIPSDTDVLITHVPPAGILDVSSAGLKLGCTALTRELARVRPHVHCFGHVHASRGMTKQAGIHFVNAVSVNSRFELVYPPVEVEISSDAAKIVTSVAAMPASTG